MSPVADTVALCRRLREPRAFELVAGFRIKTALMSRTASAARRSMSIRPLFAAVLSRRLITDPLKIVPWFGEVTRP